MNSVTMEERHVFSHQEVQLCSHHSAAMHGTYPLCHSNIGLTLRTKKILFLFNVRRGDIQHNHNAQGHKTSAITDMVAVPQGVSCSAVGLKGTRQVSCKLRCFNGCATTAENAACWLKHP